MESAARRLADELSRRISARRAGPLGAGALVVAARPFAERMIAADPALAAVAIDDATLQASADTMTPGSKARRTDMGGEIHPLATAGVDRAPGAVEADALRVYHDPLVGFYPALIGPFLSDLSGRSLQQGNPAFLMLSFEKRVKVCLSGLSFSDGSRVLYEAAAAVPFTAFCAAAEHPIGTSRNASGYRVMGYPGAAPNGYYGFSYRRKLAKERTKRGYLP